jgi:hypothetical protein
MITFFYVIFPLFSGKSKNKQVLIFIAFYVVLYILKMNLLSIDSRLFYYFPCFLSGILLSGFNISKFFKQKQFVFIILLLLFFLLSWMNDTNFIGECHMCDIISVFLVALTGTFFILSISYFLSFSRLIRKVGGIIAFSSMSAYMFHRVIISFVRNYVYWPEDGIGRYLFLIIILLPIIILIGYYIQYFYDKIIYRFTKQ